MSSSYLGWARAHCGRLPFDLSISGMPAPTEAERGRAEDDGDDRLDDDPDARPKLRAALAHYLARPEAEVVPALGTAHALWLACAATLRFGDEAVVESPVYEPLVLAAAQLGARVVPVERPAPTFALTIDRVLARLTPRTRLVSISNLHNPSGVRTPDELLADLATELDARGVVLHVDEVYAPFDPAGDRGVVLDATGRFARSACRLGRVVATGSLTKVYGLGAARIGYLAGPADLAERARDILDVTVGDLPSRWATFAQQAFSRLAGPGGLAERSRDRLGTKRERVTTWAAAQKDLLWSAPAAGLFGLIQASEPAPLVDAWMERAARREGVQVTPGRFFGVAQGFRLAWSLDDDKLDQALERLARARYAP